LWLAQHEPAISFLGRLREWKNINEHTIDRLESTIRMLELS